MKFITSSQKILQQESDNLPRRTQHLCSSFLLYKIVCACAHESTRTLLVLVSGEGTGEEAWLLSVALDFAAALPSTSGRCLQMPILVLHFWDDFLVALPSGHKYPGPVTGHTCVPEFPMMRPQLPFAPPRHTPPSSPQICVLSPICPHQDSSSLLDLQNKGQEKVANRPRSISAPPVQAVLDAALGISTSPSLVHFVLFLDLGPLPENPTKREKCTEPLLA